MVYGKRRSVERGIRFIFIRSNYIMYIFTQTCRWILKQMCSSNKLNKCKQTLTVSSDFTLRLYNICAMCWKLTKFPLRCSEVTAQRSSSTSICESVCSLKVRWPTPLPASYQSNLNNRLITQHNKLWPLMTTAVSISCLTYSPGYKV